MNMYVTLLERTDAWVIALALFVLMIVALWLGKIIGSRIRANGQADKFTEVTGISALLFFLLAFTFAMSGSRYDTRRSAVVEEANDIGTALLRSDLYPADERVLFRKDFKNYVEARIAFYNAGANEKAIRNTDSLSQAIAAKLWNHATRLSKDPANLEATRQMVPALNAMIDIITTRLYASKEKVPESILIMLFFLSCSCSFFGGYSAGRKGHIEWVTEIGFCFLISLVILFTLDLDRPRRGFVNLDVPNQAIVDLRKMFGENE